eukprot:3303617-Prymnesium_polylepis.1
MCGERAGEGHTARGGGEASYMRISSETTSRVPTLGPSHHAHDGRWSDRILLVAARQEEGGARAQLPRDAHLLPRLRLVRARMCARMLSPVYLPSRARAPHPHLALTPCAYALPRPSIGERARPHPLQAPL